MCPGATAGMPLHANRSQLPGCIGMQVPAMRPRMFRAWCHTCNAARMPWDAGARNASPDVPCLVPRRMSWNAMSQLGPDQLLLVCLGATRKHAACYMSWDAGAPRFGGVQLAGLACTEPAASMSCNASRHSLVHQPVLALPRHEPATLQQPWPAAAPGRDPGHQHQRHPGHSRTPGRANLQRTSGTT